LIFFHRSKQTRERLFGAPYKQKPTKIQKMKVSKLLLLGAALAGFASVASAQVEVYIAGSTAYRGGVTKAIQDVLARNGSFSYAWDGGSAGKGVYGGGSAIFSGTVAGQGWTVVHTYWTGSVGGCVDVSASNALPYMADNVTMAAAVAPTNGTNGYGGGVNIYNTGYNTISHAPNVAMSDSFAASVALSVATAGAQTAGHGVVTSSSSGKVFQSVINNAGLTQVSGSDSESVVGLLPFVWVAGVQSTGSAPFTNLSQEAAASIINDGYVPMEQLGVAGDTSDYAFLIGRNEDSGTRVCAQAEAQSNSWNGGASFGAGMTQYYCTFTGSPSTDGSFAADDYYGNGVTPLGNIQTGGGSATVADFGLWPADAALNTEKYLNWGTQGHSGQIGGGDVAGVLEASNPLVLSGSSIDGGFQPDNWVIGTSKAYFIGYLGLSDASGVPTTGSHPGVYLSYNGVPYSVANILNGTYTFWSYEHMYTCAHGNNVIASNALTVAKDICDKVYELDCQTDSSGNTDSTAGTDGNIKAAGISLYLNSPDYSRSAEGALLTPTF
jgi:hypothetical protein